MKQVSEVPWDMSKTLEQLGGDEIFFRRSWTSFSTRLRSTWRLCGLP